MSQSSAASGCVAERALRALPESLIVRVAAHYTALRQLGTLFRGRCPLCESADSFWVEPADGSCRCSACDVKHDAIELIQAVDGIHAKLARARLRRRIWKPLAPIIYESRPVNPRRKPARKKRLTQICGARNRRGTPCQCKALGRGGRCKFHGGKSTGPRTPEGKARSFQNLMTWKASQGARDAA